MRTLDAQKRLQFSYWYFVFMTQLKKLPLNKMRPRKVAFVHSKPLFPYHKLHFTVFRFFLRVRIVSKIILACLFLQFFFLKIFYILVVYSISLHMLSFWCGFELVRGLEIQVFRLIKVISAERPALQFLRFIDLVQSLFGYF